MWLLAEALPRQADIQLRALDAAAGTHVWSDPGMAPFTTAEGAEWDVRWAGQILVAASLLVEVVVAGFGSHLHAAIYARSRFPLNWDRRRGMLHRTMFAPSSRPQSLGPASPAMRMTPIGRRCVRLATALSTLHLMSLVRTGTEAVITVVMRIRWPSDGPGTDPAITGVGPQHLVYSQRQGRPLARCHGCGQIGP